MLQDGIGITENCLPSDLGVPNRASATGVKLVIKLFACYSSTPCCIESKELDALMSFTVVSIPAFAALSSV